jgi:hypothetical protein
MATEYTAAEAERRYIASMGPALGRQYYLLHNECQWVHFKWAEFVTLFGTNPERIDLLNQSAPQFFRMIQDCLWEDVLLHLCRMTDPTSTRKRKENLTIRNLSDLVVAGIRPTLNIRVDEVVQKTEFARDGRNRRIAHKDLSIALRTSSTPLAAGSRADVKSALDAVARALNVVEFHYCQAEVAYDGMWGAEGAESLLYTIRRGLKAEAAWRERLRSGEPLPEDIGPPTRI